MYNVDSQTKQDIECCILSSDILMCFNLLERFYNVFPSTANMQI
jgi:hypothetical protein